MDAKVGDIVTHDQLEGTFRVLVRSPYLVRVRDIGTGAVLSDRPSHFTVID